MTFALKRIEGVTKPSGLGGRRIIVVSLEKKLLHDSTVHIVAIWVDFYHVAIYQWRYLCYYHEVVLCSILKVIPDATIAT